MRLLIALAASVLSLGFVIFLMMLMGGMVGLRRQTGTVDDSGAEPGTPEPAAAPASLVPAEATVSLDVARANFLVARDALTLASQAHRPVMQAVAEPTARQEAARATGNTDEAGAIAERLRMLYIDGKETREAYLAALATFDRANKVLGNARSDVLSKVL